MAASAAVALSFPVGVSAMSTSWTSMSRASGSGTASYSAPLASRLAKYSFGRGPSSACRWRYTSAPNSIIAEIDPGASCGRSSRYARLGHGYSGRPGAARRTRVDLNPPSRHYARFLFRRADSRRHSARAESAGSRGPQGPAATPRHYLQATPRAAIKAALWRRRPQAAGPSVAETTRLSKPSRRSRTHALGSQWPRMSQQAAKPRKG